MAKQYLDDNGNPIAAPAKVYLDDNGNPIGQPQAVPQEQLDRNRVLNASPTQFEMNNQPGILDKAVDATKDAVIGAGKGLLHTGFETSLPDRRLPNASAQLKNVTGKEPEMVPQNTAQKAGYTGEQVAEWLVPTGAEEKGAMLAGKLAKNSPKLAKFAVPAGKLAAGALESGARNVSQGGDFGPGAAAGVVGAGVGKAASWAAPKIAEVALAPGKRLLKSLPERYNLGKVVLENSKGASMEGIADQLTNEVGALSNRADDLLKSAGASGKRVSLGPSRHLATSALDDAIDKNAPQLIQDVGKAKDQLHIQYGSDGKPMMVPAGPLTKRGAGFTPVRVNIPDKKVQLDLPEAVDPFRARQIRQGVDSTIDNWDPASQKAGGQLRERLHGALSGGIHDAVPAVAPLDKKMSMLIPARDAAHNTSYNPGITKNVFERFARPTGALAGAGFGGYQGYQNGGGMRGAALGAGIGLTAPIILTSPEAQMWAARKLFSPNAPKAVKGAQGLFLQANR